MKKEASYEEILFESLIRRKDLLLKPDPDSDDIDYNDENKLFLRRSMVIKGYHNACLRFIDHLKKEHRSELNHSKENIFPRAWMLKDKAITEVIDKHPSFIPFINYLYNRNRHLRGQGFKNMVDEADKLTNERRYLDEHKFSTFLTNNDFYKAVNGKTGLSQNTVQRYLGALAEGGIIKKLYDSGRYGILYADGYFMQTPDNKYRKVSFLKNDPLVREELRSLPERIRKYTKSRVPV